MFGPEYIIPKPLDSRVLIKVAPAVAQAAQDSGAARISLPSQTSYVQILEARLGPEREIMRKIIIRAQQEPPAPSLPAQACEPLARRAAGCDPETGSARAPARGRQGAGSVTADG